MLSRHIKSFVGPKTLAILLGATFALLKTFSAGNHGDLLVRLSSRQLRGVKQQEVRVPQERYEHQDDFFPREHIVKPEFVFREDKPKAQSGSVVFNIDSDKARKSVQNSRKREVQKKDEDTKRVDDDPIEVKAPAPGGPKVDDKYKADHVVNPHPFKVHLSNPDLCKVPDLFIIVYVHTASDHYKRRAIIRQTWGNIGRFPNMRILFVMGNTSSVPMMQSALEFEAQTYKDILQEDFEDTYKNLTYKGIAALKWISHNCKNAKYILKTDDDVFVNMYTIQNHFQSLYRNGYKDNLILCLVWWKMHALREGKWAIPVEDYPESLYPPYCSGMAYMFSIDIAAKLYDVSFYVKFFWVDDVYISGMLPRAAGLSHTTMIKAYCGKNEMEDLFTHPTEWYKYAFTHIHDEEMFLRVWDRLSAIAKNNKIQTPRKIEPGLLADEYLPKDKVVQKQEEKKGG